MSVMASMSSSSSGRTCRLSSVSFMGGRGSAGRSTVILSAAHRGAQRRPGTAAAGESPGEGDARPVSMGRALLYKGRCRALARPPQAGYPCRPMRPIPGETSPAMPAATAAPAPDAASGPGASVHAVLVAVQVMFGVFHVVAKAALAEMAPLALAGIRALVAAPLLLALAWRIDRVLPRRRDLPILALLGALGVLANQVLFIEGL